MGRETPGRGWVRGTRARWGGRPGEPFSHHTIVLTKASGGRSHISPLPENVDEANPITFRSCLFINIITLITTNLFP